MLLRGLPSLFNRTKGARGTTYYNVYLNLTSRQLQLHLSVNLSADVSVIEAFVKQHQRKEASCLDILASVARILFLDQAGNTQNGFRTQSESNHIFNDSTSQPLGVL